jgi:tetratricopeptide (TPR) repeat protein
LLGEANCNHSLGEVALAGSDRGAAQSHFEESLVLFRRIGGQQGEAGSFKSLGDAALTSSHFEKAIVFYEKALAIYKRISNAGGEAETTVKLGLVQRKYADEKQALINIEAGFARFFSTVNPDDRALPGWRAMYRALISSEVTEVQKYRELARESWTAIERLDLVFEWAESS